MHFFDQRIAGIAILVLWALPALAKGMATGSLLKDKPKGGVWIWLTYVFNFLYLLEGALCAAILLIVRFGTPGPRIGLGAAGMLLYALGCILMSWALLTLRGNSQVGEELSRASDELVTRGCAGYAANDTRSVGTP